MAATTNGFKGKSPSDTGVGSGDLLDVFASIFSIPSDLHLRHRLSRPNPNAPHLLDRTESANTAPKSKNRDTAKIQTTKTARRERSPTNIKTPRRLTTQAQARGIHDVAREGGNRDAIPRCLQRLVRRRGIHLLESFRSSSPASAFASKSKCSALNRIGEQRAEIQNRDTRKNPNHQNCSPRTIADKYQNASTSNEKS